MISHNGAGPLAEADTAPRFAPSPPTAAQQLLFAEAACRPESFQIYLGDGSNNLAPGWMAAHQAVSSGKPYLGRTHPWIWAIDVDAPESPAYTFLRKCVADAGLEDLEVDSGGRARPGRHLYVHVHEDDATRQRIARTVREAFQNEIDFRLQAGGSPIRPPMAPHRHGGFAQPLVETDEALEILLSWAPLNNQTHRFDRLSRRAAALLIGDWEEVTRHGVPAPRRHDGGVDRSAVDVAVAQAFITARYTLSDYISARTAGGCHPSEKACEQRDGGVSYLQQQWQWAQAHPTSGRNLGKGIDQLHQFEQIVDIMALGRSARKVIGAFISKALELGVTEFGFSQRDIAEAAGLGQSTVSRAINSQQVKALLEPVGSPALGDAQVWRLRIIELLSSETVQNRITHLVSNGVTVSDPGLHYPSVTHPVFLNAPGALRATGHETLRCFDGAEPRSQAEAMRHRLPNGPSTRTFKDKVAELKRLGILLAAEGDSRRYVINSDFDWDALAAQRGLFDVAESRKARHDAQRAEWDEDRLRKGWISANEFLSRTAERTERRNKRRKAPPVPHTDDGRAIDPTTGEVDPPTRPLVSAGETPMEVEMPLHRRVAAARNCECCGTRTDRYEPRTGLPWHEGCRMPAWIARHHKRRGLKIPSALVAEPAEVVDRYGDDWRQPFQRQAVAA